jgi:hypothetical protein
MRMWVDQDVICLRQSFPCTDDVILGRLLSRSPNALRIKASRLNIRKNTSIARETRQLTKTEEQVIVGGLFGDLCARISGNSRFPRLEGGHCQAQADYMRWKLAMLERLQWRVRSAKQNTYLFTSKSLKALQPYHQMFYPQGKKVVSPEALNVLNDFGLLIWYLDDGTYRKRDHTICLYTNSFTEREQHILCGWFWQNYHVLPHIYTATDQKNYPSKKWYYLYFPRHETTKLLTILAQFDIPDCMRYKFGHTTSSSTSPIVMENTPITA